MHFFKYTLPWVCGFFNGLFVTPTKNKLLDELLHPEKNGNMENNTLLDDSWDVVSFSSESVTIDVLMKVGTWYTFKVCLFFYVNLYFYFNNVCLKLCAL